MEQQQKFINHIGSNGRIGSNLNLDLNEIPYGVGPNTQKSIHNASRLNNLSRTKTGGVKPQVVISYNFENGNDTQVRTHNLLIGLDEVKEENQTTYRKNLLHRGNYISTSNDILNKIPKPNSTQKHQLLRVKSNDILHGNSLSRLTNVQSFHQKKPIKEKNNINHMRSLNENDQNGVYFNTFWAAESQSGNSNSNNDTMGDNKNKNNKQSTHERYINTNLDKIASRKSLGNNNKSNQKNNHDRSVYTNSIQKLSRRRMNEASNSNSQNVQNEGSRERNQMMERRKESDEIQQWREIKIRGHDNVQVGGFYEHIDDSRQTPRNKLRDEINFQSQDDENSKLSKTFGNARRYHSKESVKNAYGKKDQNNTTTLLNHNKNQNKANRPYQLLRAGDKQVIKKKSRHGNMMWSKNDDFIQFGEQENKTFSPFIHYPGGSKKDLAQHKENVSRQQIMANNPSQKAIHPQMSNYHRNLIEQQNQMKRKKKYRQLIKNVNYVSGKGNKNQKALLGEEFYRIESENQIVSTTKQFQTNANVMNEMKESFENQRIEKKGNLNRVNDGEGLNQRFNNTQRVQSMSKNDNIFKLFQDDKKANEQITSQREEQKSILIRNHSQSYENTNISPQKIKYTQKSSRSSIKLKQTQRQRDSMHINIQSQFGSNTRRKDREQSITKRKLPTDYNEFLKILSQQNEKKRELEDAEKQKQKQLCNKSQKFKDLVAQNQHIKRIMTPIGKDFLQDRHDRLSYERKENNRKSIEEGSNIDDNTDRKKWRMERDNRHGMQKMRSQQFEKPLRDENRSKSMVDNFNESVDRKNKWKVTYGNGLLEHGHQILESEVQSENGWVQEKDGDRMQSGRENKVNEIEERERNNNYEQKYSPRKETNLNNTKKFTNTNNNQQGLRNSRFESSSPNKDKKPQQENKSMGKLTGMKIPAEVIARANSKLSRKYNQQQLQDQRIKSKNNQSGQNRVGKQSNSLGPTQKNKINNGQNEVGKNGKQQNNKKDGLKKQSKKENKNKEGKIFNKLEQQKKNNLKSGNKQRKPTDVRTPKQKQRHFKDWRNGSLDSKDKKKQGQHSTKDKQLHNKDQKQAKKKEKKSKFHKEKNGNESQSDDSDEEVESGTSSEIEDKKSRQMKSGKNARKVKQNQIQQSGEEEEEDEEEEKDREDQEDQEEEKEKEKEKESSKKYEYHNPNQNQIQMTSKKEAENLNQQQFQQQQNVELPKEGKQVEKQGQKKFNTTLDNFMKKQQPQIEQDKQKQQTQAQKQIKAQIQAPTQQQKSHYHEQVLQNLIHDKDMQQQGFMQITSSKHQLFNHQSEKSILSKAQTRMGFGADQEMLEKRAEIVRFLYGLPEEFQREVEGFVPDEITVRIVEEDTFYRLNNLRSQAIQKVLSTVQSQKLKKVLQQILVYDNLRSISTFGQWGKNAGTEIQKKKKSFFRKIFEPYMNEREQYGVWVYCSGVWRLILVPSSKPQLTRLTGQLQQQNEHLLFLLLQHAISKALQTHYYNLTLQEAKPEQLIRMIVGLRVSTLTRTKTNINKIFKQIEYNTRKSHIIRAISSNDDDNPKFSHDTVNCVRKIESTPTGEKVIQIVSCCLSPSDNNTINNKQRYFWIKQDKFLQFFTSFTIISKRQTDSYWTNNLLQVRNEDKAVYMIESSEKHTSGSLTVYPLEELKGSERERCTITFYKEIEPQVLKLIGRASERLPKSKMLAYTSRVYFEFNIKGTYFVFLQLQDGEYNVAIESNSSSTSLDFVEFVKKETLKNEQCEYVEIDKMFRKKPNVQVFKNSREFKQLMNFMKKTAPSEMYEATK